MLKISEYSTGKEISFNIKIPNDVVVPVGEEWKRLETIMKGVDIQYKNTVQGFLGRLEAFAVEAEKKEMEKEKQLMDELLLLATAKKEFRIEHENYINEIKNKLKGII